MPAARRSKNEPLLQLELGGALAPPLPRDSGITRKEVEREVGKLRDLVASLRSRDAASGFLKLPGRRAAVDRVVAAARRARRRRPRDLVQVGIGGSSLGAEALFRALAHPAWNLLPPARRAGGPRLHFLDNVDPDRWAGTLDVLDPRKTLVHVVSKSGTTVETAAGFQLLRRHLGPRWADSCVFTTGRGALADLARAESVDVLDFPEDVGGRFSVLTPSGLFAPAVAGLDVRAVVEGAGQWLRQAERAGPQAHPALVSAAVLHRLSRRGVAIHVLMPYSDALEPLSRWYVQLSGESLGKRGKGLTPLPARGATDQHSQVQLFVDGPRDKLVTFVEVEATGRSLELAGGAPAPYLEGVELGRLLRAELEGTEVALASAGRPSTRWVVPRLEPRTLGALFVALELQVAAQAELLRLDAYDQPGVEAGKRAAYALLGRPGFEDERERIEAATPPRWTL